MTPDVEVVRRLVSETRQHNLEASLILADYLSDCGHPYAHAAVYDLWWQQEPDKCWLLWMDCTQGPSRPVGFTEAGLLAWVEGRKL